MSEAVYGLLGALGGALITGAGAYWGPVHLQRHTLTAQREQAEASRREAETTRIILMRTTTRVWRDLLERTIQDLELGRQVDIEAFDDATFVARSGAQSALDHALHDGIWIRQSGYGYPSGSPLDGSPQQQASRSEEQSHVLQTLERVTALTRAAVIVSEPLGTGGRSVLRSALDGADKARGALSSALLNRLEQVMGVTVLEGQPSTPRLISPHASDGNEGGPRQAPQGTDAEDIPERNASEGRSRSRHRRSTRTSTAFSAIMSRLRLFRAR
ncbi:hypothetical protein [Streptomyces sp. KS 21]|uniref:hypothetical protein n=1 Tax=Streptomyces sp. KS 21 TaxID=2485150 RepID=UPI001064369E|nr:hypothetical protein [Streptomyces sp. KS 21]TDU73539.1 hypothetical protein EDD91_0096 [Streptomyces sp. KS 21]